MRKPVLRLALLLTGLGLLIQAPVQGQIMIDTDLASWVHSFVGPCPTQWQISPTEPTSSEIVSFKGPTKTFSNSCWGERFYGGDPGLMINGLDRTVELIFIPPSPSICTLLLSPVCGLQGTFGPLKFGTWTFKCTHPQLTFEIKFNVDGIATTRDVIYVDGDLITLTPDGFAWNTAFTSLQQALAVAEYGSLIKVAQGTYKPTYGTDRNAVFEIPSGVSVVGGFRGNVSFIILKDADPKIIIPTNPEDHDPEAFPTILSGDLNGDDGQGFEHHHENVHHVVDVSWADLNTTIEGVTITGGFANGFELDSMGGGLLAAGSEALIRDCRFIRNAAVSGGAVANRNFTGVYDRCIFEDNLAIMHGGAVANFGGAPVLVNCLMVGNRVPGDAFLGGAAVSNTTTDLYLTNCTIADNEAMSGGAVTFFGGPLWSASNAWILNSILYGNGGETTIFDGSEVRVNYTDIQGGWSSGQGNLDVDPLFMWSGTRDASDIWQSGNYHLQGVSPCINAGDPTFFSDGTDIDGDPRILGGIVEMGVDELIPLGPPPHL